MLHVVSGQFGACNILTAVVSRSAAFASASAAACICYCYCSCCSRAACLRSAVCAVEITKAATTSRLCNADEAAEGVGVAVGVGVGSERA